MAISKFRNESVPALWDTLFGKDVFDLMNTHPFSSGTLPAINIRETADSFIVDVAAPGMSRDDFKLRVEDNFLHISSEKQENKESSDEKYTRKEFSYSSFQRSFELPGVADSEKISASYQEGILHIQIPKKEEARKKPAREISIN